MSKLALKKLNAEKRASISRFHGDGSSRHAACGRHWSKCLSAPTSWPVAVDCVPWECGACNPPSSTCFSGAEGVDQLRSSHRQCASVLTRLIRAIETLLPDRQLATGHHNRVQFSVTSRSPLPSPLGLISPSFPARPALLDERPMQWEPLMGHCILVVVVGHTMKPHGRPRQNIAQRRHSFPVRAHSRNQLACLAV